MLDVIWKRIFDKKKRVLHVRHEPNLICSTLAISARWLMQTPFGGPVVPEEKNTNAWMLDLDASFLTSMGGNDWMFPFFGSALAFSVCWFHIVGMLLISFSLLRFWRIFALSNICVWLIKLMFMTNMCIPLCFFFFQSQTLEVLNSLPLSKFF